MGDDLDFGLELETDVCEVGGKAPEMVSRHPPCSVLWTPIPGFSWIFPIVGHMGMTDDAGKIYEFMGMGVTQPDSLSFGPVTRYVPLPPKWGLDWNMGVLHGCRLSEGRPHMGCVNNCHTFVADSMNHMKYLRFSCWNSVLLALMVFFFGRYPSLSMFAYHWVPSALCFGVMYFFFSGHGPTHGHVNVHI